ncbi:hypothetical protein BKA63DRAFT_548778 [Paraphoma chrysanthemicola]|nr:hypothetical protein BKA63DRAFT_548778 [Paraphoma chrysanthemicola]
MASPNAVICPRARCEKLRNDLRQAIESIRMNTTFTISGSLFPAALVDIGLVVEGIGSVEIPLISSDARALVELSAENHRSRGQASLRALFYGAFRTSMHVMLPLPQRGPVYWKKLSTRIEPQLIELILQTWDSGIVFPSFGFAEDSAHLATLVVILPSRHDGGRIEISRAGAVMDFSTARQSESEFPFLAVRHDATVAPTAITAGARVGLCIGYARRSMNLIWKTEKAPAIKTPHLCLMMVSAGCRTSLDSIVVAKAWALRQPFRSESPRMKLLREILSSWMYKASGSQYPSMLVYTLESDYCLDMISCPDFEGDDLERLHALTYLAGDLDLPLYYTILSQRSTSTNDTVDTQRLLNSDTIVNDCALEMMLRLHDGTVDDHVNFNVCRNDHSAPFSLSRSEIIYNTSRQLSVSETSSRRPQRRGNGKVSVVHTDVLYLPAVLIVPAVSKDELEARTWVTMLHSGVEEPMHIWLDYLLSQGKKHGTWLDEEMRSVSRKFLDLVSETVPLRKGHTLRHVDSWSRALDLIARIGMELGSDDIFRGAMIMRNQIDEIFYVLVIERFETSQALEKLMICSQWNDLNWWVSLQLSLRHTSNVCNHIHDKLLTYVEELEKPKSSKANEPVSRRPRRPLTQIEVEVWRRSRVPAGDALRLCKLCLDLKDDLLRGCAQSFLTIQMTDADFIISDLRASSAKLSQWGFPEEVINRYIMDFISPAIRAGPVVYAIYQRRPLPQKHERLLSIVCSRHTLGRDFPRLLVSLAKMFTKTVADTVTFLKHMSPSPYWTTPLILKEIGIRPASARKIEYCGGRLSTNRCEHGQHRGSKQHSQASSWSTDQAILGSAAPSISCPDRHFQASQAG